MLLITDGLPNCNASNNVNTCAFTTPTCATPGCGFGALDCLDDSATNQAAAALKAANIRVFVVGFDPTLTTGNNLSVLNAIASAGGTTSAYTATNKTQLAAALNQIALNTATCCKDACTAGAKSCGNDGTLQTCQFDATVGCTVWSTSSCGAGKSCSEGSCGSTCTDACTFGALRCSNQTAEQCVKGASGCTAWVTGETCDSGRGETCESGECKPAEMCKDGCVDGAFRCGPKGPQVCVKATACTGWQDLAACGNTTVCAEGACRPKCAAAGELSNCQAGTVCTSSDGVSVCLPGDTKSDGGVVVRNEMKDIRANAGCGCQMTDSSVLAMLGVLGLMWASRARRKV